MANDASSAADSGEAVDRQDFARQFSRDARRIYAFVMTLVFSHHDAEEVFQNTSVVLWNKFSEFRPGSNFFAWASRIAYLEVLDLRKRRRGAAMISDEGLDVLASQARAMSDRTSARMDALEDCLGELAAADRELIRDRYYSQCPPKELAETRSRSLDSIYRALSRIHRRLLFDGSAELESAWSSPSGPAATPLRIDSGEAVRMRSDENGELVITRHAAEQSYFVTQVSMASDTLVVPPAYVKAVQSLAPVGYWRMEGDAWPLIRNEMNPRFQCRVNGALGRTGRPGNQGLEFGVTDEGGEILCDESFDDLVGDSYSLEVWIKPSHFHVGAVVSLVGDPPTPNGVIPHGLLLEMGGSGQVPTAVHHPGRIRFLHRSPASNSHEVGTSCYSSDAYILRKWQHVVAVKDGSTMSFYINGELAGQGEDASALPAGLRMLVGRLYPSRQVRPFKGQLDELALYGRALKPEEILRHYRLVRPQPPAPPAI